MVQMERPWWWQFWCHLMQSDLTKVRTTNISTIIGNSKYCLPTNNSSFENCFRKLFWSAEKAVEILIIYLNMMTSSNGNIFRVTGHLCGEFTGPRWIPHIREAGDFRRYCTHYDVSVMNLFGTCVLQKFGFVLTVVAWCSFILVAWQFNHCTVEVAMIIRMEPYVMF